MLAFSDPGEPGFLPEFDDFAAAICLAAALAMYLIYRLAWPSTGGWNPHTSRPMAFAIIPTFV